MSVAAAQGRDAYSSSTHLSTFDVALIVQELPEQLGLDAGKAQKVVTELAKDKKHTTLVQARCVYD